MDVSALTLVQLWRELSKRGIKTAGKKQELIARLETALREEAARESGDCPGAASVSAAFRKNQPMNADDSCEIAENSDNEMRGDGGRGVSQRKRRRIPVDGGTATGCEGCTLDTGDSDGGSGDSDGSNILSHDEHVWKRLAAVPPNPIAIDADPAWSVPVRITPSTAVSPNSAVCSGSSADIGSSGQLRLYHPVCRLAWDGPGMIDGLLVRQPASQPCIVISLHSRDAIEHGGSVKARTACDAGADATTRTADSSDRCN